MRTEKFCSSHKDGKGAYLPVEAFHQDKNNKKHGLRYECKECTLRRRRLYYDAHGQSDLSCYNSLRRKVLARGMRMNISLEEYQELRNSPCAYGGGQRPDIKIGIDRKNTSVGYTPKNCVPCCARHNEMKRDFFNFDEMTFIVQNVKSARDCGNPRNLRAKLPRD